jgi:hypothetical protein
MNLPPQLSLPDKTAELDTMEILLILRTAAF